MFFQRALFRTLTRLIKQFYVRWVLKSIAGLMPMGSCGRAFFRLYRNHDLPEFLFPYEPNYAELEHVDPQRIARFQRERDLHPDRKRFLVCGRLTPVKRMDVVIEAFARVAHLMPEWDLVLAGSGPLREELEASIPRRPRHVNFLDFCSLKIPCSAIAPARCWSMPVTTNHGGW